MVVICTYHSRRGYQLMQSTGMSTGKFLCLVSPSMSCPLQNVFPSSRQQPQRANHLPLRTTLTRTNPHQPSRSDKSRSCSLYTAPQTHSPPQRSPVAQSVNRSPMTRRKCSALGFEPRTGSEVVDHNPAKRVVERKSGSTCDALGILTPIRSKPFLREGVS
jgi:hypothetical protein